jgi:hypothetical protein
VISEVFQALLEFPVPLASDRVQSEGPECADFEPLVVLYACLLLPEPLDLCLRDPDLEPRQVPPHAHRIQHHDSTDKRVSKGESPLGSLPEDLEDAPLDCSLPLLLGEVGVALRGQDLMHEVVPGGQRKVEEAAAVVGAAKFHCMLLVYGVHARVKDGFPCLDYKFPPPEIDSQVILRLLRFSPTDNDFLS